MRRQGFTIVELLIVIVVIGILAAITIVAYNGITTRASVATLQSDLESSAKLLQIDYSTNSAYPATIALANNGHGLQAANGNTYTYTANNTTSPSSYCLSDTNAGTSTTYFITSTNTAAQIGGCSVTNIFPNPNMEGGSVSGWVGYSGGSGTSAGALMSSGGYLGTYFVRNTWSVATTASVGGIYFGNSPAYAPVSPGSTYSCSAYVRPSKSQTMRAGLDWKNSSAALLSSSYGDPVNVSPSWTRLTVSGTAPAGAAFAACTLYANGGTIWNVGDYLDADAGMITQGTATYNYGDGASPGWIWNGTANASTSTGVPL